jgi:putative FmdB family regulatory protein
MPIYEYSCSNCNLKFELLRPLAQASEKASCPRCHNNAERIFSTFAAVSKDESGMTTPTSNPCAACSAVSCDSCNL